MSDAVAAAVALIDRRLDSMKRSPGTWGSPESLELQALLLLELRTFLLRRRTHRDDPYEVRDAYARFVAHRFPESPGRFMVDVLPAEHLLGALPDLVAALRAEVVSTLGPEDPFLTAALAVEIRFSARLTVPSFAEAAHYIGQLLSAVDTIVHGTGGRSTGAAFTVPDVRLLSSADAGPGILFAFDPPLGESRAIQAHLEALKKALLVVEWASGAHPVLARVHAALPDEHERAVVARSALLFYPHTPIQSVIIGGEALRRAPVNVVSSSAWRVDELINQAAPMYGVPEEWLREMQSLLPSMPPRLTPEAYR